MLVVRKTAATIAVQSPPAKLCLEIQHHIPKGIFVANMQSNICMAINVKQSIYSFIIRPYYHIR